MYIHPVSQRRIFFFIILFFVIVGHRVAAFQSRSVDVQATTGTRVETTPGRLLTLSFKVTNTGSSKKRFESIVVPPAGWRRLAKEFPFEMEAGAADIRLLSISIPAETPAGDYPLRYKVRDAANQAEAGEVVITVVIAAVTEQDLKHLDAPRLVVAGDAYKSVFILTNKGNVQSLVRLKVTSSNDFPAIPDSSVVHLSPGESRTITVDVATDAALMTKVQDILEVTAELDPKSQTKVNSYVQIVPRVTGVEERYVRLPVTARVRFAGESDRKGAQLEIAGAGALSPAEDDRLEILVRTPDIQQKSILGRRDEYQLSYATKKYELFLGDKNFSLSPLTEYNRYAFGVSGDVRLKSFSVGGFVNDSRFLTTKQREFAGYVHTSLTDAAQVGINYLRKQETHASDVVTARTIVRPSANDEVDLEYGVGNAGGAWDDAYAARWTGRGSWYSYDTRYVHSGAKFPGYFRDVDLKNLSMNISPLEDLRIEGYYRDEKRNLARDTNLVFAPRDRYYQVGAGYANFLSIYYRSNDQDDLLPVSHFRRRDETWQFRAGFSLTRFMLLGNADLGTIRDKIAGTDNPYKRYTLYASVQPLDGHTYGFTVEYTDERDPTTLQTQHRLSGSFSLNVFLGESTQLSASLFGNRTRGEYEQTYSLFDVSFEHTFPFGHSLVLRGRQSIFTPSEERKEIAYLAEYAIPIGVPIARSTESGQLAGRVIDAENGTGVPNILLYAGGATAVTDRNGDYSFPSLKPEKYVLQVDMSSAGLNKVPLQRLPQELTIVGGQESRFDISLSRSVTIDGTVLLYPAQEQAANDTSQLVLKDPVGHAGVVVELSNTEEVNRRLTDNRGRFAFSDIRPGRWTLRILDGNLPQNYYFEKDAHELTVAPGQTAEMSFKALPRKRRVQIVKQGQAIEIAPQKGKPETAKPKVQPQQLEKPKTVEVVAPKADSTRKLFASGEPKPVRKIVPARQDWNKITSRVVFVPAWLRFGIEFSEWSNRQLADSAASYIAEVTGRLVYVEFMGKKDAPSAYRIVLGGYVTRKSAENALSGIRSRLLSQDETPPPSR